MRTRVLPALFTLITLLFLLGYLSSQTQSQEKPLIKTEVVSRPSACDVCHDLHFIYVFNEAGKVLKFVPLQVAKYENEEFDEDDPRKMKNSKEKASSRPFQSLP